MDNDLARIIALAGLPLNEGLVVEGGVGKQTTAELLDQIELDVKDTIGDCPEDPTLPPILGMIQALRQGLASMTMRRIKNELVNIEERITDWLHENTEEVFEEAPDMDNARSAIQDFFDGV